MRIKELRESHNMQQKELASALNIPPSTLSQYETGKREPNIETVTKIAKLFDVTTDYIYGISDTVTCRECGLTYSLDNELDVETHREIHAIWLKAKEKYGFCYSNLAENERIKAENRNIVKDFSQPLSKRYDAQIEVFKCLFSRALDASNYSDSFISFEEYISMLLNQPSVQKRLGKELYEKMLDKFGAKEGIPDGQTYYYQYEVPHTSTLAAHFSGDEYTESELNEIRQFAEFVKNKRK